MFFEVSRPEATIGYKLGLVKNFNGIIELSSSAAFRSMPWFLGPTMTLICTEALPRTRTDLPLRHDRCVTASPRRTCLQWQDYEGGVEFVPLGRTIVYARQVANVNSSAEKSRM